MQYNTSNIIEATDSKIYLKKLIKKGYKVEVKRLSDSRTALQNRALHKFFVIVSDVLNELGHEFHYEGIKGFKLTSRYNETIVKEFFWRPIQLALFAIESTTDIGTKEINEIADVIIKYFGEKGVHVDFPRKDLMPKKTYIT